MRTKRFEAPPFVVWRIEDAAGQWHYRLAPHAVLRHLLQQCFVQWVGFCLPLLVAVFNFGLSRPWGLSLGLISLPLFVACAFITNILILLNLNAQSVRPIEALFSRCPSSARKVCDASFPSISNARFKPAAITLATVRYFLQAAYERYISPHFWKRNINFARLQALTLRREDSSLLAFSAFAAVTSFVPPGRRIAALPAVDIKFLLSYFSPVGFGFALCMLTFCCHPFLSTISAQHHMSRFPFMLCAFFWFTQGIWYLLFTLRQDFASLFKDYFESRRFPKSMTHFANEQMERAPDLVDAVYTWVPWTISFVIVGLAGLYAAFLHSLVD
jgi:hypothetical protein